MYWISTCYIHTYKGFYELFVHESAMSAYVYIMYGVFADLQSDMHSPQYNLGEDTKDNVTNQLEALSIKACANIKFIMMTMFEWS